MGGTSTEQNPWDAQNRGSMRDATCTWGIYWGYWDSGKENGNYYVIIGYILGLYWDTGKENGNYYVIIGYILGLYGQYVKIMVPFWVPKY